MNDWMERDTGRGCPNFAEQALLGAVDPTNEAIERHLNECPACRQSRTHLARVLAEQLEALPPVPVTPSLWDRIERRISDSPVAPAAQPWKHWHETTEGNPSDRNPLLGVAIQRARSGAWQATAFQGVEVQPLAVSSSRRQATMLVRMQAGSSYPAHRHRGPEECFVLSGDLWVGEEISMGPGDFQRAEAGSDHPRQSTRSGCLLLIQTSLDDELLE